MNFCKKLLFLMTVHALSLHEVHGVPFEFKRIIITDKNNIIIKVIDLISDFHESLRELVKNPSRRQRTFLSKEDKKSFTTAERTLLITLRKLAKQGEPIQLLWEHTPNSEWQSLALNHPMRMNWILYSNVLQNEFAADKGASIVFNNGDTYRYDVETERLLYLNHDSFSIEDLQEEDLLDIPLKDLFNIKELKALLGATTSKATKDLDEVKGSVFKEYYQRLYELWGNCVKDTIQPLYRYVNKMLLSNPDITLGGVRQIMSKAKQEEAVSKMINSFAEDVANIEFLIKMFAQPYKHTIVYAGGVHCDKIAQLLYDNFDGIEVIDLGSAVESFLLEREEVFIPILLPRTWFYLAESPQKSFRRFKSNRRSFINRASTAMWNDFASLRDVIAGFQVSKKQECEVFDQKFLELLKDFYKKASKTFIDFINVRDEKMKTLLFYAVEKNLLKTTEFLLNHNARVNVQDIDLNTPLHYAETSDITMRLLEHGATMNIKNNKGKTAVQHATIQKKNSFLDAVDLYKARKVK